MVVVLAVAAAMLFAIAWDVLTERENPSKLKVPASQHTFAFPTDHALVGSSPRFAGRTHHGECHGGPVCH